MGRQCTAEARKGTLKWEVRRRLVVLLWINSVRTSQGEADIVVRMRRAGMVGDGNAWCCEERARRHKRRRSGKECAEDVLSVQA